MTEDRIAAAARSTAAILAPSYGPDLSVQVESALTAHDLAQRPDRYLDPDSLISLASLIVAIATLAWTVYNDQRSRTSDPEPDTIARHVRITLREQDIILPTGTDRILEVVATEIIRHAAPSELTCVIILRQSLRGCRQLQLGPNLHANSAYAPVSSVPGRATNCPNAGIKT